MDILLELESVKVAITDDSNAAQKRLDGEIGL